MCSCVAADSKKVIASRMTLGESRDFARGGGSSTFGAGGVRALEGLTVVSNSVLYF